MTPTEAYTSLKLLYKQMMFPNKPYAKKWTLAEIDELDVHFFYTLMEDEVQPEKDVYLSDVW